VVTGDITHGGRRSELARFRELFRPLISTGRLTVVPGNHDRLGDDVADELMAAPRVNAVTAGGLFLVRVDSTGPHNRELLKSQGHLASEDLEEVDRLLASAPADSLRVVLMHHHPLRLPEDTFWERQLSRFLSAQCGAELERGAELVRRVYPRCDLLLHGHRHQPCELGLLLDERDRPLSLVNAGCSPQMRKARVFTHAKGQLAGAPAWIESSAPAGDAGRQPRLGLWSAVRAMGLL
ncbi:MAG: metallophosphoesterase family protein, partial [Myxococcaceae bacterium]